MRKYIRLFSIAAAILFLLQGGPAAAAAETTDLPGSKGSGIINILLVGQDGREKTAARSDSMILCSFLPKSEKIVFTSFLRDLYVTIPGHEDNRLNAAYAFGGTQLLKQTLQDLFQIEIYGCLEADFSQFPKMIDALGGVSITLRQDEAEAINREVGGSLSEGTHLLTGEEALAYSRIRKLDHDGDFSRSLRQRKLLTSLLSSYRSADLLTLLSAVADTLPMISTDLSKRQILQLCVKLFPMLENPQTVSQRIPADGTYSYERIRNMEVLTADPESMRQQLHQSLKPEKEETP